MINLHKSTINDIDQELHNIPFKYQKPFNSVHEGLAILREEYIELENEIFFGEKKVATKEVWKANIKKEAIQVACMAIRIAQELTK